MLSYEGIFARIGGGKWEPCHIKHTRAFGYDSCPVWAGTAIAGGLRPTECKGRIPVDGPLDSNRASGSNSTVNDERIIMRGTLLLTTTSRPVLALFAVTFLTNAGLVVWLLSMRSGRMSRKRSGSFCRYSSLGTTGLLSLPCFCCRYSCWSPCRPPAYA